MPAPDAFRALEENARLARARLADVDAAVIAMLEVLVEADAAFRAGDMPSAVFPVDLVGGWSALKTGIVTAIDDIAARSRQALLAGTDGAGRA